jgi:hypothetical protein
VEKVGLAVICGGIVFALYALGVNLTGLDLPDDGVESTAGAVAVGQAHLFLALSVASASIS